jgi:hypothetical protein
MLENQMSPSFLTVKSARSQDGMRYDSWLGTNCCADCSQGRWTTPHILQRVQHLATVSSLSPPAVLSNILNLLRHNSMICHDRADKLEGRPKRNWSEEQFLCSSCTVKALNKRPRRGRKPKDVVATDPEDTVNGPEIPTGADAIMDISQPAEANLAHDPAKPSIEHAKVEQLEPPFSDPEPGRIPEHAAASHPHAPNGVHSPEQYLETLAQAQRFFAASTLDSPPRQAEQNAAPNPLLPAQYSTEPALAGQAVASHCLGSPLPESAQYAQNPQFNGYPQVYPNQWTPATNTVPHNEAMMNGKAYIPPSQVTPHESAHSILNGNGQVSHPPSNPQLGYPQATVQP